MTTAFTATFTASNGLELEHTAELWKKKHEAATYPED